VLVVVNTLCVVLCWPAVSSYQLGGLVVRLCALQGLMVVGCLSGHCLSFLGFLLFLVFLGYCCCESVGVSDIVSNTLLFLFFP